MEVVLRMLVIKRLYNWSYEQTERFVNDSIVLRQFCRLYLQRTPDDTTLIRWANVIGSQTVASLNERAVELARSLKITRGRKLRVDCTVVETNIHHPTDSALLGDGVRVLSACSGERRRYCPPRRSTDWARRSSAPATAASGVRLKGCTGSPGAKQREPKRISRKLTGS